MNNPPDHVLEQMNVSRETSDRFRILADLLCKWNPRINLVSNASLNDLWVRHILDSVQIFNALTDPVAHWVDLGSGGGFPGLVIGLMSAEKGAPEKITLIESDQRKCAFLRTVLRETGTQAQIIAKRIEHTDPQGADVLSARALADLPTLFTFAERHLATQGCTMFPKGVTWKKEVELARESWSFDLDVITSKTEPNSVILKAKDLRRV